MTPNSIRSRMMSAMTQFGTKFSHIELLGVDSQCTRQYDQLLECDELPILKGSHAEDDWFLITTKHLVICSGSELEIVPWTVIKSCNPSSVHFQSLDMEWKTSCNELVAELYDGSIRYLKAETGAGLIGVWNVIRLLIGKIKID